MKMYKGFTIEKTLPNGYYETYTNRFIKADTIAGLKKMINEYLKGGK